MSSWAEVHHSLGHSPVDASPDDFGAAANHFCNVRDNTRTVIAEFSALTSGDTTQFDGQAAAAFVSALQGVATDMRDIPDIADQIAWIFSDHQHALAALRTEVDRALAVAISTRSQRDTHSREVTQTSGSLASIRSQLSSLRSSGAEESDPQVSYLRTREMNTRAAVTTARTRLTASEASLAGAVRQYHDFDGREHELNRRTADRLNSVQLGSMSDPSNLEKVAGWADNRLDDIGAFVAEMITDIVAMRDAFVNGLIDGEWDDFLWRLNDVLREVGTVLAVAALVVAVVASGGMLAVVLAGLAAAFALGTLATSITLMDRQSVDEQTGRTMSRETVIQDMIGATLAVAGFGVTAKLFAMKNAHTAAKVTSYDRMTLSKHYKNDYFRRTVHTRGGLKATPAEKDAFKRWNLEGVRRERIESLQDIAIPLEAWETSQDISDVANQRRQRLSGQSAVSVLRPPVSCISPTRAVLVEAK